MARASLRRSSSSATCWRKPSSARTSWPAAATPTWRERKSRSGFIRRRSVATESSMAGRRTFTATSRPSWSRARWTTAIDARPIGVSSKVANVSSRRRPVVPSIAARTSASGTAGPVSRQERNSRDTRSPKIPGAEATSCPNLTNVPPSSSNVRRNGRAKASSGAGRRSSRRAARRRKCRAATRTVWSARRRSCRPVGRGSDRGVGRGQSVTRPAGAREAGGAIVRNGIPRQAGQGRSRATVPARETRPALRGGRPSSARAAGA